MPDEYIYAVDGLFKSLSRHSASEVGRVLEDALRSAYLSGLISSPDAELYVVRTKSIEEALEEIEEFPWDPDE